MPEVVPGSPVIVSARHFATPSQQGWDNSYRMIRLLGRGTMGSVYLAEQLSMARPVALKILSPALAGDKRFVERFLHEARASARLNHPNIVSAIDFGEIESRFYLAMEFVDGEPLNAMLEREGALDEKRVIGIGLQVIAALRHAAQHHVVHLDVKPANIMIRKDGQVKLADFGLAMLLDAPATAEGPRKAAGTPYYMAPEQVEGGKVDWRTDQYSLGASLYEAVTGRKPFQGASISDILMKRFFEKPEPAWKVGRKVSRSFSAVLAKMLTRSPEGRYQSFEELEGDFNLAKDGKKPLVARLTHGTSLYLPASPLGALAAGTAIERVDSMARDRQRKWLAFSVAALAAVLVVYGAVNAKLLMGPQPPRDVNADPLAEAKNLLPDTYHEQRINWEGATSSLRQAERDGGRESYQAALHAFRELLDNRRMQDSVYYPAAKANFAYIEKKLSEFEPEAKDGGRE